MSEKEQFGLSSENEKTIDHSQTELTRREFIKKLIKWFWGVFGLGIVLKLTKGEIPKENVAASEGYELTRINERKELSERWRLMEKSCIDVETIAVLRSNSLDGIKKFSELIDKNYNGFIKDAVKRNDYSIDSDILKAMIILESGGDPNKGMSHTDGAVGLMQILPKTAKMYDLEGNDRLNPEKSIDAAVKILKEHTKLFGDQDLAIENYHIGYGNTADLIILYCKRLGLKDLRSLKDIVQKNQITYREIFFNNSKNDKNLDYSYIENKKNIHLKTNTYRILFERLTRDNAPVYLWKIKAIAQILKDLRDDPEKIKSLEKEYAPLDRKKVLIKIINKLKKDGFSDEQIKKIRLEHEFK